MTVSLLLSAVAGFGSQAFAQYDDKKLVILETNLGTIVMEFFFDDAPNHVNNFVGLTESGFYDGTLFHRIIPGFMIQGGDPNTISGDPSTWGIGGPSERVNAEFNTIKHNRGIVSMARSPDPNSGGSQFFILHNNANFLDEQYTVFGRIVTEESFETLDKIAAVKTDKSDKPTNPEQVKITKAFVVNRSEVSNLLELSEPERTQSVAIPPPPSSTGNQKYESVEYGVSFSVPEGWMLREHDKTQQGSPSVVAVGPKVGEINPKISFTVQQTNQRTMDDLISENSERLKQFPESVNFEVISQERKTVNGNSVYVTYAKEVFSSNGKELDIKFKEVLIYDTEEFYTFSYANDIDNFDSQLSRFDETIGSFEILSKNTSSNESVEDEEEEVAGCLIATATYGSEMASQVQQLRELRDNSLLLTQSGTTFMAGFNQFYYSFSPTIADLEREHPAFKEVVKIAITPMVSSLLILNHVDMDSEVKVLGYGLSLIMLNIGMYIALPAIVIHKLRK